MSAKDTVVQKDALSRRGFLNGAGLVMGGVAVAAMVPKTAHADEATPEKEKTKTSDKKEPGQIFDGVPLAIGHVEHDKSLCSGCRTCEIVCTVAHRGVASSELSNIQWRKNIMDGCSTDIYTCKQCPGAECVAVCPTGALHTDKETGARVIDESKCVGCQTCLNACPVNPSMIRYDPTTNKCYKCDLCNGDPQCVKFCPTGALQSSWVEKSASEDSSNIYDVEITGDAAPWAHVETANLTIADGGSGIEIKGVLWTSHATLFNIVQGLFDITGEIYDASGGLIASSNNTAHIEIPEMSSGEFTLDFSTSSKAADVAHAVLKIVGTNVTNTPGQGA